MFSTVLCLFMCVSVVLCKNCPHNNGTDNGLHYFNCDSSMPIQVKTITVTDGSGNPVYPLDPDHPFTIHADTMNSGGTLNKVLADIDLYHWGALVGDCHWAALPSIPFLHNVDACKFTTCPVPSGDVKITIPLDLTPVAGVIKALGNDQEFQLKLTVKDQNAAKVGCVYVQLVDHF